MKLKNILRSLLLFTFVLKLTFCDRTPCNFATERQKVRTLQFVFSSVLNKFNKLEKHKMLMSPMLFALLLFFHTHTVTHTKKPFCELFSTSPCKKEKILNIDTGLF